MKELLKFFIPIRIRIFLRTIISLVDSFYEYLIFKINFKKYHEYFDFNGGKYKYFYHFFNTTFQNERAVEIPIILDYIYKYKNLNILEIGNVLSHYIDVKYDIVDKYEIHKGVINCDIIEFTPPIKYDLIISVSTFEHIGFDEVKRYSDEKSKIVQQENLLSALEKTKSLLNLDGTLVFTVPIGFNSFLDSKIEENKLNLSETHFLKRISLHNEWKQVKYDDIKDVKYGRPFKCANGLMIGILINNTKSIG